ncbi:hypothetical protein K1T71_006473 [Dendrolimus kikuchii]|uniref:Uncharacterized protein n=1 Tax=Dendrolimus kikuchii TaxID=765133 RepID=A0ACC1D148_9NEOP|nr:hypothetical protein K1T71_006473 [Dendrolimus kikuchii]
MKEDFVLRVTQPVAPENKKEDMENVKLEDALDIAGAGRYQIIHCSLMLAILLSAMLEMIGIAFVLPAAACDLDIPDSLKGILTSIPNIGVIITAPFWGRAADSHGRKPVLLLSTAAAGLMGFLAAFMPNLLSFALCKFAESLFLSCPSSLCFPYACEIMPKERRDKTVLITNGLLNMLASLNPILAWAILPFSWEYQMGIITFKSWRLLTLAYSLPLLLSAIWMTTAVESPKFLMTKNKQQETLKVLKRVYSVNTGLSEENYSVKSLKNTMESSSFPKLQNSDSDSTPNPKKESSLELLRLPHLKWLALTGFLMFGLFSLLNGLFLLAPDALNKLMTGASDDTGTICETINQTPQNQTSSNCVDTISQDTFRIMVVSTIIYGVLVTVGSFSPFSKKTLLVTMYSAVGVACLTSGLSTNRLLVGITMSALQITALGIGPLTAYAVHLFPTRLRGTAVGAVMMFGRLGSAVGANAAGYFLSVSCSSTFYGFTLLLFLCAALSFLLPGDHSNQDNHTQAENR